MQKSGSIDFTKLLGFDTVSEGLPNGLDFKDEIFGDKLGAKLGTESSGTAPSKPIQFSKLLGFETIAEELSKGLNFHNDALSDKLGAKIGPPEPLSPCKGIDFNDEHLGA